MSALLSSRTTLIWLLLICATALSWEVGHGFGFRDIRYASTAVIIVAFIKVRFVIQDFMEIRHAPIFMRIVGEMWTLVICTTIVVLYWRGASQSFMN